jgi:phosphate:Na+ symporter
MTKTMDRFLAFDSRDKYVPIGQFFAALTAALLVWTPVFAATPGGEQIDWLTMGMTLLGGLAVFLFGMEQMAVALKQVAGDSMKRILRQLTGNRIIGLITGAFVTAIIQSSSVTTVMLVGFVTAGLMSLSQAVGVILGADIGTTITAQIVAFKVTKYALLLVAVGFSLMFMGKTDQTKQYGQLIMGLGLIFFGMGIMSDGMSPLRSYEPFFELMQNVSNPLIGIMVGTLFTALIQSSSATMGVVIVLALQGLITLETGIALALGANIGTCATAGLASIGKPREAVRVAVAHVTFKVVGVLLIVWFIPQFAEFVRSISPAAQAGLTGMDKQAAEVPRQIANAHTLFNVGMAFVFLPFIPLFVRFCDWLVPDKPLEEVPETIQARYLDEELITTPSLALHGVRLEIGHMGDYVIRMLNESMPALLAGDHTKITEVSEMDDKVDVLHADIIRYLGLLSKSKMIESQSKELISLLEAANDLENIGDIIETDAVALTQQCVVNGIQISEETQEVITRLHKAILHSVATAVRSVESNDSDTAREVIAMKEDISNKAASAQQHQAVRLVAHEPKRVETYAVEVEIIEKLKRIYYFSKRMAKTVALAAPVDEQA